jgi:hypothetical protein
VRVRLCAESLILSLICLADMLVTLCLVRAGIAVEQNPLMAACIDHSALTFVAVKILSFAPFVIAVEIYRRRNPMFAKSVCRLAIATYLVVFVTLTAAANLPS